MKLFKFQQEDVDKLKSKRARLIGNDPGTGKTFEAIALDMLNRQGDGNSKVDLGELFLRGTGMKTLVVCPKSVIDTWDRHCMELTDEDVFVVDTKNRHLIVRELMDKRTSGYFIVNWEFLRLELDNLKKVRFLHIIADECHRAKNRKAQQTRALKQLDTIYKTAMSGTPADNKPQDLWSILNWLWPNYYTSYWKFVNAYVKVEEEETQDGNGYRKLGAPNEETIPFLHDEMRPWFARRLKEDVLPDLPDKYHTKLWVDLDPKQRRAYDQMRKTMMVWIEEHEDEIEAGDPIIAQAAVSQLVRLQQYADGYLVPLLDDNGEHVHKLKFTKGTDLEFRKLWRGIKTVAAFEKFVDENEDELYKWDEDLPTLVPQYKMVDPSSKLDALMEMLEDRDGEQLIVFSQFKAAINLFGQRLAAKEIPHGLYTGDTGQADRARIEQEFQAGKLRVFAGTIAAGGVGLTLTASSTVVFLDRSWSPAINLQAEDRAHRIGQKNAVEIIDIMARDTVDLGKSQQLAMKMRWLKMILGDKVDDEVVLSIMEEAITVEIEEE